MQRPARIEVVKNNQINITNNYYIQTGQFQFNSDQKSQPKFQRKSVIDRVNKPLSKIVKLFKNISIIARFTKEVAFWIMLAWLMIQAGCTNHEKTNEINMTSPAIRAGLVGAFRRWLVARFLVPAIAPA